MARPLRKLLVVLLFVACFFAVGVVSKEKKPVENDVNDLICHTDNPAECYPRVFQATDEFQPVHADQDLPPGLHVRLNIWTGSKEAKLNNESEDAPAALKGLPVDQSVVLVDQPAPPDGDAAADTDGSGSGARLPKGAPTYDPVGLVKKPETAEGSGVGGDGESPGQAFYDAVAVVKGVAGGQAAGSGQDAAGTASPVVAAEQARFDDALETLMDVSHDIYYGLKLAEDADAVRLLFCLGGGGGGSNTEASAAVAQKASSIVAAALQNNPAALREVERVWGGGKTAGCTETHGGPSGGAGATLADFVYGPYVPTDTNGDAAAAANPAWVRSRLLAVSSLLKSEAILQDFLASGGLTEVLRVLVEQTAPAYDAVRTRAANLVLDNFLDASMGADVSLWSAWTAGAPEDKQQATCADAGGQVLAHCWDYHAEKLAAAHRDEGAAHWSAELWRRLQERAETARTADEADHSEL